MRHSQSKVDHRPAYQNVQHQNVQQKIISLLPTVTPIKKLKFKFQIKDQIQRMKMKSEAAAGGPFAAAVAKTSKINPSSD